jgi:DNA-binding PadR family transcriptional regulator
LHFLSTEDISVVDTKHGGHLVTDNADPRSLPLRPPVFHILLALAGGDLHGLGIADEVERASEGVVQLGPGTLYRSLADMVRAGLIRGVEAPADGADPRRKYYRVTPAGRALLAAETRRLGKLVEEARGRHGQPDLA